MKFLTNQICASNDMILRIDILEANLSQVQTKKVVIFDCENLEKIDLINIDVITNIVKYSNINNIIVIFHNMLPRIKYSINLQNLNYFTTILEQEILDILKNYNIQYSVQDILKYGIAKFNNKYVKNNSHIMQAVAKEQNPHTLLITCSDSRIDSHALFSAKIGEFFIVRNVGNIVPPYNISNIYSEVAAIEFALNILQIKHIAICAHTECGAVKAAISSKTTYNGLDSWIDIIRHNSLPCNLNQAIKANLLKQIENLKTYPIVNKLLTENMLQISAWIYNIDSGEMTEF